MLPIPGRMKKNNENKHTKKAKQTNKKNRTKTYEHNQISCTRPSNQKNLKPGDLTLSTLKNSEISL